MNHRLTLLLILLLALSLAACNPTGGTNEPAAEATTPVAATGATATLAPADPAAEPAATAPLTTAECPNETDTTHLLRNPQHGYCLLYPTTHKVERPGGAEADVNIVVGSLLNASDPRASVSVSPAGGQTIAAYADEVVAGYEGFEIARSETTVAGQPAIVLDNVPGQDFQRRVIFLHEDRLYHLSFSPINPDDNTAMDAFAQGILSSFTFIPVSDTVTAADECVAPKTGQQSITSEAFDFCVVVPAKYTLEEASETNANLFVGSMMDVQHPKLMIEVTDAADQTATQATDALVLSFPDMDIQRTSGESLGYAPAERLDGVPGQDVGRVLLVVHDDKLYRLTFVPADPSQTEVYAQMEALFSQVLNTWRFLP